MEKTANVEERLTKNQQYIDELIVHTDETMAGMSTLVKNANNRLTANEQKIDGMVGNLYAVSANLEEISAALKLDPWKLLYRDKEKNKRRE